jgi:hypothetical protein
MLFCLKGMITPKNLVNDFRIDWGETGSDGLAFQINLKESFLVFPKLIKRKPII